MIITLVDNISILNDKDKLNLVKRISFNKKRFMTIWRLVEGLS